MDISLVYFGTVWTQLMELRLDINLWSGDKPGIQKCIRLVTFS